MVWRGVTILPYMHGASAVVVVAKSGKRTVWYGRVLENETTSGNWFNDRG